MKIASDKDKSNKSRMFLLSYIDKELKLKTNSNSFFVQKTININISNFKVQFEEIFSYNNKSSNHYCDNNNKDTIQHITLSSKDTESTTSKILHKDCQKDKSLRTYCSTLKLTCANPETKRRKKYMCLTNIIKESSIEQIKNTLKKRRNRKSNSVCYIINQK